MSFTSTSTHAVELEHHHTAPIRFTELEYPYTARVNRREWQMLLDGWERLQPTADRFATVFFDTLFSCEPTLRHLFGGTSLETQFLKFAHLLTELVPVAEDPEAVEHRIDAVVRRYVRDAAANHDRAIREAITAMLAEVSAARLTAEMRLRWKTTHATVVTIIRNGARLSPHGSPTTLMRNARIAVR